MKVAEAVFNVLVYVVIYAIFFVGVPLGIRHWWMHRNDPAPIPPRKTELLPDAQAEVDALFTPYREAWDENASAAWGPSSTSPDHQSAVQSVVLNRTMRGLPSWMEPDGTVY